MKESPVRFIPYQQPDEPPRRAGIARVEFDIEPYSDEEVQLLGHLCAAAEAMNAVFRDQFSPATTIILSTLATIRPLADAATAEGVDNYLSILALQNAPWALLPRKNHLLQADRQALARLAEEAGVFDAYKRIEDYLFEAVPLSDMANFYPHDLDDAGLDSLGEDAKKVNTSLIRSASGEVKILLNEQRYRKSCEAAVFHLKMARALSSYPSFQLYLDAKIEEMHSGSEEARRLADYHWVRHDSPFDIIISSAIEVYLDNWKNAKGAAAGNVMVTNTDADALLGKLIGKVPELEANAPWTHRRSEIDPEKLPKLKFVDVLVWSGDYVTGPMTTIAQSLPNDEWVGKNIGTVNMVYRNTGMAVHSISGSLLAEEFLPKAVNEAYGDLLFDAGQLHSALHEIGHTTGKQDDEHQGEPRDYLESEYSSLEETRAELFGMWAAEMIHPDGIIDRKLAEATHYAMLLSMIGALKFEPKQAHMQARNMMWHYFIEQGAIECIEEDGRQRFQMVPERTLPTVESMLKIVADLKASGDKDGAKALREKYCYTDELMAEIEARTKDAPLGRGLIFPEIQEEDGRYKKELLYPEFTEQRKFKG